MSPSSGAHIVVGIFLSPTHSFSKRAATELTLLEGLGIEGDAHCGATVKHRSRVAVDPAQPNLRQVHLLHAELLEELQERGFIVHPGDLGENLTTRGLDLLSLSRDTLLRVGRQVVLRVTGLRNPCAQIDGFSPGLLQAVVDRAPDGRVVRKAGVMAVVIAGGIVRVHDPIEVQQPSGAPVPLDRV